MESKRRKRLLERGFGIYFDIENGEPVYFVHFCPFETKDFPHGLTFKDSFKSEDDAERFIDKIEKYLGKRIKL